jgi:hypothetical protein
MLQNPTTSSSFREWPAHPISAKPGEEFVPPSEKQFDNARWLAAYKNIKLPANCRSDQRACWRWIHEHLNRIDREDARSMQVDFKRFDLDMDNPFSVIGALKYRGKVLDTEAEEEQHNIRRSHKMLKAGSDPFSIADRLDVTDAWMHERVRRP